MKRVAGVFVLWSLVPLALGGQPAPEVRSVPFRQFPDATTWPESVDCADDGRCWLSSIGHRVVYRATARGDLARLPASPAVLPGPATAVRFDRARRLLWVATSTGVGPAPQQDAQSFLLALDPETGRELRRIAPPGGVEHVLGDLAIAADGTVLVSDSRPAAVYRLDPGAREMRTIADPRWRSPQGITLVPGTSWAILADYSRGLFRLDLRTDSVRWIEDQGASPAARGTDGLVWHDGAVIGIRNGVRPARITRFVLDDSLARLLTVNDLDRPSGADEPTNATILGGALIFVGNSSWDKHDADGHPLAGLSPTPPQLWRLPLPSAAPSPRIHRVVGSLESFDANAWWLETPDGVVLIDALMLRRDVRSLIAVRRSRASARWRAHIDRNRSA